MCASRKDPKIFEKALRMWKLSHIIVRKAFQARKRLYSMKLNKDPGSSAGSRGVPSSSSTKMGVGRSSAVLGALLSGGEEATWVEGQGDWVTCRGNCTSMSSPQGSYPPVSSQVIYVPSLSTFLCLSPLSFIHSVNISWAPVVLDAEDTVVNERDTKPLLSRSLCSNGGGT